MRHLFLAALLLSAPSPMPAQTASAANPLAADAERLSAELNPQVVAWRRDFHKNPELGNRETRTAKVIAQLPVDVATYLMNEKREWLNSIETLSGVDVILVPNRYLDTPAYELRRVRDDELGLPEYSVIKFFVT